jgi:hypothetical protein
MPPLSPLLFRRFLIVIALFILFLGSFAVGITIGERKGQRFSHWCENYPGMVPGRPPAMDRKMLFTGSPLPSAHGVFGTVLSTQGRSMIIQGKDGREEAVLITPQTSLRVGRENLTFQQLPPNLQDMEAAVFGVPTPTGQMEARLIRLFPRR